MLSRFRLALTLLLVVAASGLAPVVAQGGEAGTTPPASVWDGVFTEEQAERGGALYSQYCVMCHGENLRGVGMAANLTATQFFLQWRDSSLYEYFDTIRTYMPQNAPSSLSADQYADIVAYILSFNGLPAGDAELVADESVLSAIKIERQR